MTATVVIPTFDEPETVPLAIQHVRQAVDDVDVLVVDDSPDIRTRRAAEDAGATVVDGLNEGLAAAILRGIRHANTSRVAVIDADLQHPPGTVAQLLDQLHEYDLAVGSRFLAGGGVTDEWPAHRRVISQGADLLARAAVPQARWLTDPMSGLFAVHRDLVVGRQFDPAGYKALLSILARCPITSLCEVPFEFGDRQHGDSALGPREYVRYLRHLARLTVPARQRVVRLETADVDAHAPPEVTVRGD